MDKLSDSLHVGDIVTFSHPLPVEFSFRSSDWDLVLEQLVLDGYRLQWKGVELDEWNNPCECVFEVIGSFDSPIPFD